MMLQCNSIIYHIVGILLGYNLTETNDTTNQGDNYVNGSSLNELTKYVCQL